MEMWIESGAPSARPRRRPQHERASIRTHLFGQPERGSPHRLELRSREMLLEALGWCTAGAVVSHARRRGWELGEVTVEMSHVDDGQVMRIGRLVQLGRPLGDEQREELARVCDDTPVTRVVAGRARISTLVLPAPDDGEHWFAEIDGAAEA